MSDEMQDQQACAASGEDFNQIDAAVLDGFPEDRFPVDLFHFSDELGCLTQVYRSGGEVTRAMRDRFRDMSAKGTLFFTRRQIDAYAQGAACDLDAALDDPNLDWPDKAPLFAEALARKQEAMFRHPLVMELADLNRTLRALCDALLEDRGRMGDLGRIVHAERVLDRQRVNGSLLAMAVYLQLHGDEVAPELFRTVSLGFALYDIGMARVSPCSSPSGSSSPRRSNAPCRSTPNGRRTSWPAST